MVAYKFCVGDKVSTPAGLGVITKDQTGATSMFEGWMIVTLTNGRILDIHESKLKPSIGPNEILKEII